MRQPEFAGSTVLLALLAVGVLACAPSAPPAPGAGAAAPAGGAGSAALDQLYEAARKEGRLVIIGPGVGDQQLLFDTFQQRYRDVRIQPLTARGPEMIARLDSEIASGQRQLSVFSTALSTMYTTKKAGRFEKWEPQSARGLPERYKDADGFYYASSITPYGILVNTNLVPADQAPRTWKDLAHPRWRGKLIADDPRTAGGGQIVMAGFSHHPDLGWAFVESLKDLQIHFTRERPEIPNSVARGEYPVAMPVSVRDYLRLKEANAPVELYLPTIGACECATGYVGVLAGAPHPNAAKLFLDFHFTEAGQQALSARGDFPVMPGMVSPGGFPPLSEIALLPQLTEEDVDQIASYVSRFEALFFR